MSKKPFLKCKDHTVSGDIFELRYDENLGLLETFPKPEIHELPKYYKSEKYISHTDSKNSFFDKIYQWVKTYMIDQKLNWIKKEKQSKGNLLDIGAGTGDFLARAKNKNWQIHGVEPNSGARDLALKKGIDLEKETTALSSNFYDVITMWHVLEHVPDLDVQIKELDRLLKKDGILIIAVPNFKSYDAQKYKEHWAAYDVPRHLWHFSGKAIKKIFGQYNFEVLKTKGLIFDAFYVSLLSEKYQPGTSNLVSGFFTGLISNFKAKSTKEYSSVVYFLRKNPK